MNHADSNGVPNAPQHPLLAEWQRLTREGLAASRAHCLGHAMACHLQALRLASQLMACPETEVADDDRVAAFVVAHLNMADCHDDMGQPSNAAEYLSRAHRRLVALLRSDTAPAPLQAAASRQLHQTYAALSEHLARHGEHPLVARALREGPAYVAIPATLLH